MARSDQNSRLVAFGGIMAALSLVLMLLTAVIPVMDYGLPALASILMVMVVIECGDKTAWICYGAVSILALLLVPNKESALLYLVLFGWYPMAKRQIEMRISKRPLEWTLKMLAMILPVSAVSIAGIRLMGLEQFFGEAVSPMIITAFYLAACAAFVLYDLVLTRLISAYFSVIRPRYISKILK